MPLPLYSLVPIEKSGPSIPYIWGEIIFVACALVANQASVYIGDDEELDYRTADADRMRKMRAFFASLIEHNSLKGTISPKLNEGGDSDPKEKILDEIYKFIQKYLNYFDFSYGLTKGINSALAEKLNKYITDRLCHIDAYSQKIILFIRYKSGESGTQEIRNMDQKKMHYMLKAIEELGIRQVILMGDTLASLPVEVRSKLNKHPFFNFINMTDCRSICVDVANTDQFQAQLYVLKCLNENYNATVALGTCSGGVMSLAALGISTVYLVRESDKRMQRIGNSCHKSSSTFFPLVASGNENNLSRKVRHELSRAIQFSKQKSFDINLFKSAFYGNLDEVLRLLDSGANIDSRHIDPLNGVPGKTAVFIAAEMGHVRVLETLINRGANILLRDMRRLTPRRSIEKILQPSENIKACIGKLIDRELFIVAQQGRLKKVIDLLEEGAHINSQHTDQRNGFSGKTPLFIAAEMGHHEIVKLLIERGANPRIRDAGFWRPYDVAFVMEHQHGRKECSSCVLTLQGVLS